MGSTVHRSPAPVTVLHRLQADNIVLVDLPEERPAMALTATDLKVPVGRGGASLRLNRAMARPGIS